MLEANGLITLKEGVGVNATKNDIDENPKNIKIVELEAAQLTRSLQDVDMAVINGNFAIDGGLKMDDALVIEDKDSLAAETYTNIVAVKKGNEDKKSIKALVKALQSDEIRQYINDTFGGAVVPMF